MISALFVDDEPLLLDICKQFLERSGDFTVHEAESASEAFELLKKIEIDAIVCDYQLGDMDGIQFLKLVRTTHPNLPFIVFTGKGREEVVIEAFDNGADFYLQKGGDPKAQFAELQNKITQAVRRRRAEEELCSSEERYRNVVQSQTEFITRFLPDGTHIFVNDAYCRYFGKTCREMEGHKFRPEIPVDDKERVRQHFSSLTPEQPVSDIEHRIIMPDGIVRWQHWSDRLIFDVKGQVVEYQSVGRDITNRKLMEEDIRSLNKVLEQRVLERTESLNKSLKEKEVLLREIHHRVKNNLQIISSLLNLQSKYIKDDETLAAIGESQNRVKVMALVHEKLYRSSDISNIDIGEYINSLGSDLFRFYGTMGKGVTLKTDIQNILVDINSAVPIGLIINELISNSLKHAFTNGRKGEIAIFFQKEKHTLTILFRDNGVGIPQEFDWRNAKSLGLRLVIALVEQLQGAIELDRSAGTTFNITLQEKE